MIKYIERKTGHSDDGPAWIGRVTESKSGRTLYFNGQAFRRGSGVSGNYFDTKNRDEYWISNVKKNGADRHWAGSGKVRIERGIVTEYLEIVNAKELDNKKYVIADDIVSADTDLQQEDANKKM